LSVLGTLLMCLMASITSLMTVYKSRPPPCCASTGAELPMIEPHILVKASGLTKTYWMGHVQTTVLRDVSLELRAASWRC